MKELEEYLKSIYGILPPPTSLELDVFIKKILALSNPTNADIEKIAAQTFKGFGKGRFKINESHADTVHDVLKLIKKKLGK